MVARRQAGVAKRKHVWILALIAGVGFVGCGASTTVGTYVADPADSEPLVQEDANTGAPRANLSIRLNGDRTFVVRVGRAIHARGTWTLDDETLKLRYEELDQSRSGVGVMENLTLRDGVIYVPRPGSKDDLELRRKQPR